jgi:DNA polymerase-3 subunit epsilon
MRQIVLDTETTGLYADKGDRIVEIGCVELQNRKPTGNNLHFYLNPERDSHEDALRIHGISNEFLRDKPRFAVVVEELLAYLAGAELIIHNAPFDLGFLDAELERVGKPPLRAQVAAVTDTLAMAKEVYPGKRNSLDALCERLGVDNSSRTQHGALLDAELLADVYICLTRGQNALLIDADSSTERLDAADDLDLSSIELTVPAASAQELQAHQELLEQIDKTSRGNTVWRGHEPAPHQGQSAPPMP